ncbi:hypothetical protein [Bosea sp. (in: a-proteobacteria)]|jgi:hypothetical protein|uniref:hypothetical protein n=1 Tax=Bosea sp. (in: a-proteobacteria) TaxID=1871050 RepID=UPI001AD2721A|nr:hypothetical protein [Bosea sp. (in: a-proteobacteria)]MBN9439645.1 hypothetical protein [Bosea sp. (in: a-proteobacteria)]
MPLLRTSPTARTGAFTLLVEALTQIVETDDEARDKAIAKPRIEVRTATQHSA